MNVLLITMETNLMSWIISSFLLKIKVIYVYYVSDKCVHNEALSLKKMELLDSLNIKISEDRPPSIDMVIINPYPDSYFNLNSEYCNRIDEHLINILNSNLFIQKAVLLSSVLVYKVNFSRKIIINEDSALIRKEDSLLGYIKTIEENFVKRCCEKEIKYTIIRRGLLYGVLYDYEFSRIINYIKDEIISTFPNNYRVIKMPLINIIDFVEGLWFVCAHETNGKINLVEDSINSITEIFDYIARLENSKFKLFISIPYRVFKWILLRLIKICERRHLNKLKRINNVELHDSIPKLTWDMIACFFGNYNISNSLVKSLGFSFSFSIMNCNWKQINERNLIDLVLYFNKNNKPFFPGLDPNNTSPVLNPK